MLTLDRCSLEDLETNTSIIHEKALIDEGFYLLAEPISCDGRIASIEVCGVFTSTEPNTLIKFFSAALYRRQESYSFERITEPEHLETSTGIILELDGDVSCTKLSLTRSNWSALKGDVIGMSFSNSCETHTL